jgi:hypothetical protein
MGEIQSEIDEKIKGIDTKIKALEEKLDAGQISSEEYIPQLLALFYEIEELSPRARAARKRRINFKAVVLGGVVGWLAFFAALVFLGPFEFSLRASSLSSTGVGPYQTMLNLISYSDIQSIQSSQPFFVFLYYLIVSLCTFPDVLTISFPILGGLIAGIMTQYTNRTNTSGHTIIGSKKFRCVRLDEGFVAGGVVAAILTLVIILISALAYGQWLTGQGIALDDTTLPWGYLFRIFLPTLFVYHLSVGGAAGAFGEVIMSRKMPA